MTRLPRSDDFKVAQALGAVAEPDPATTRKATTVLIAVGHDITVPGDRPAMAHEIARMLGMGEEGGRPMTLFLLGFALGAIGTMYAYALTPMRSRTTFAYLVDAAIRVAADPSLTATYGCRLRILIPIAFRSSLFHGLDLFFLASGLIRVFATGGDPDDDAEVDPIRLACVREQIEAVLLDSRPEVGR